MAKKRKTTRRLTKKRGGKNQRSKGLVGVHDVECRTDGCYNWKTVPADVTGILCWRCLAAKVPPPVEKKPANVAKAALRSLKHSSESAKDVAKLPDFPKGWHRRKHFKIKIDGKWYYFLRGAGVSRDEYLLVERNPDSANGTPGAHSGYGRGWHLKKRFVAPDGKIFEKGKEVKK